MLTNAVMVDGAIAMEVVSAIPKGSIRGQIAWHARTAIMAVTARPCAMITNAVMVDGLGAASKMARAVVMRQPQVRPATCVGRGALDHSAIFRDPNNYILFATLQTRIRKHLTLFATQFDQLM